jgi:2'-5' RNA ligase superfamily
MQMLCDPNGRRRPAEANRPDLYALVIYLPDPLGSFLDRLRLELAPGCNPHAHVSVLPPRHLPAAGEHALEQGRQTLAGFPPFEVGLGDIDVFPVTEVVYIRVEGGAAQLGRMHAALNRGHFQSEEPFAYHPHVTLAQEMDPAEVERLRRHAIQSWRAFRGPRSFRAEQAVFVKNISDNLWTDLETIRFGAHAVPRR